MNIWQIFYRFIILGRYEHFLWSQAPSNRLIIFTNLLLWWKGISVNNYVLQWTQGMGMLCIDCPNNSRASKFELQFEIFIQNLIGSWSSVNIPGKDIIDMVKQNKNMKGILWVMGFWKWLKSAPLFLIWRLPFLRRAFQINNKIKWALSP